MMFSNIFVHIHQLEHMKKNKSCFWRLQVHSTALLSSFYSSVDISYGIFRSSKPVATWEGSCETNGLSLENDNKCPKVAV